MPDNNNLRQHRPTSVTPEQTDDSKNHLKMSKAKSKWLRRMTLEVNKFPYSNTKTIGLYSFNKRTELEWYYKEIRLLTDKVLDILECPYCEDTIKQAVMPRCGCDNPVACCKNCWLEAGSICFNCKKHCRFLSFEPADEIIRECHLFLKEKAFNKDVKCTEDKLKRVSESYYQFLKQSEMQLMCNYCFGTLENVKIVVLDNAVWSQVCTGCYDPYMECYNCTDVSPYPTFDRLNTEFCQFFSRVLHYCKHNMKPIYSDPYPDVKQPSYFKRLAQRQRYKGKIFGVFKSAIVVAACAYLVLHFVQ